MNPVVATHVDPAERRATITTVFSHPAETVWTLWSDPEKLARWWGPPGLPLTVNHHDLRPGGRVEVIVTLPDTAIRGHWSIISLDPPRSLRFTFASDGIEPTDITVLIEPTTEYSATMVLTVGLATAAQFDHAKEIGLVEGVAASCGNAHSVLAASEG